ncbi:CDF family Co(II)/Ni(II) efflux transporter DmeF [Methylobacterium sp. sgz302541]|uniref:CDF family Co(II)/Ni(II) efflux transporter DmeF n=1 Tax=unclassified Methylobacterium TaxID=2615210 RepID=UPI003D329CA1
MHAHSIERHTHEHVFLGERHARNERRTWAVVALTAVMMVAEIAGGMLLGSLALVADGWHMSTHAAALGIAALAYRFARTHARDPRFSFGTGKFGDLAAFASAVILGMIALFIAYESVTRLIDPVAIAYAQAIPIAVLGLGVNLASVWLLHDDHGHDHDHHHGHDHAHHGHHDSNFRAAYVHVLADALTSVLAIVALLGGLYAGLAWLDPLMGLVGTGVILAWSVSLMRGAGAVLLDAAPEDHVAADIRARLETDGDRVSDLHLWQIGPGHRAAVVSLVSHHPQAPSVYKARLSGLHELSHVTVEVEPCPHHGPGC